jgi:hypothetical protein
MSLINFGYRVDMYAIDPPTDPSAYLVAYDLDGVLKQKDYLGNVTILGGGSIGPQGVAGPVGPGGLTWSGYWLATQSYNVNYAVGYASASWWCIADVVGTSSNLGPNIDTTHWALLAAQGSPGPIGPGGTAGLQGARGATGGVGLTPSLQQVGDIGATFSKTTPGYILNFDMDQDGYTRIQRQEGTEVTRYYQEGIQIDISHYCPETDIESQILFNRAYLSLHQGVISTGKSTTIDFLDPTNNTNLKIPAKSADGVYTIATLDDIIGVTPSLQQVLSIGGREVVIYDTNSDYYVNTENKSQYVVMCNPFNAGIAFTDDLFELGDEIIIYLQNDYPVDVYVDGGETTYITYGDELIDESQYLTFEIFTELHFRCWTPNGFILTTISKPLVTVSGLQEVTDVNSTTNNSIEVTGSGDERVLLSNSAYISITNQDSTEMIAIEPNMVSFSKNGFNSHLKLVGTVSGGRTYQLPDQSGIIALLSDITGSASTLQQVLDNNHELTNGRNFQGTNAGSGITNGEELNGFGSFALVSTSSSNNINAFGYAAGYNSFFTDNVNAFGYAAGYENSKSNVNLFGFYAEADDNNQTVFTNFIDINTKYFARLSFKNITTNRKWELPDTSGTIALLSDITGSASTLQQVLDTGFLAQSISGITNIQFDLENNYLEMGASDGVTSGSMTVYSGGSAIRSSVIGTSKISQFYCDDAGNANIQQSGNGGPAVANTNIVIDVPTSEHTTYHFPVKSDGDYIVATLDDIYASASFVPYNGANSDVNLGANTLNVEDGNELAYFSPYGIEIYENGTPKSSYIGTEFIGVQTGVNSVYRNRISLDPNIGVGIGTNTNYDPSPYAWIKSDNINTQEYYQLPDKGGIGGTFAMIDDLSLQQVTNIGATTSNEITVGNYDAGTGIYAMISPNGDVTGSNTTLGVQKLFYLSPENGLQLVTATNNSGSVTFKGDYLDTSIVLQAPDKPTGTYTIATLNDIGAPIISATYGALQALVDTNQLIVGSTYILLSYQTIYQINGSNTTGIVQLHIVIGQSSSYSQFVNVPTEIGGPGNYAGVTVTVAAVVPGSTLTVGQSLTIVTWFSSSYIIFSPTVVGVNIGCTLKFEKQRYPNVTAGATYSDAYGKPIMKPGGVLNTEVHDGGPYMSMTASENPAVLTESIILKAIDTNKFSRDAESLTFPGDKLIYDYTDNIVYDENGNFRANKPGTIIQRSNISGTIVMNKDWRVQRYRRYGVDSTNWSKLTLATASVYKIGATSECTVTNASITADHKYIASDPYIDNFFNDFSKTIANVFLTGTNSAPSMSAGERANYQISGTEYMNVLSISSFTSSVKDFNIIPIVNGAPTALTTKCIVNNVNNTVFLPYSQTYGTTFNLNVESKNGDITNSTFTSLPRINNTGKINKLTVIDYITLNNFSTYNDREDNAGSILNSIILSYASYANTGEIVNTTIGGGLGFSTAFNNMAFINSSLFNCVIGGHRNNSLTFENLKANKSLICLYGSTLMTITGKIYLTALKNSSTTSYTSNIKLNTFNAVNPSKSLYGYLYDFSVSLSDMEIDNMTLDKRMVYQYLDNSNVLISATVSVVQ